MCFLIFLNYSYCWPLLCLNTVEWSSFVHGDIVTNKFLASGRLIITQTINAHVIRRTFWHKFPRNGFHLHWPRLYLRAHPHATRLPLRAHLSSWSSKPRNNPERHNKGRCRWIETSLFIKLQTVRLIIWFPWRSPSHRHVDDPIIRNL